jgi:hypothetical protein
MAKNIIKDPEKNIGILDVASKFMPKAKPMNPTSVLVIFIILIGIFLLFIGLADPEENTDKRKYILNKDDIMESEHSCSEG